MKKRISIIALIIVFIVSGCGRVAVDSGEQEYSRNSSLGEISSSVEENETETSFSVEDPPTEKVPSHDTYSSAEKVDISSDTPSSSSDELPEEPNLDLIWSYRNAKAFMTPEKAIYISLCEDYGGNEKWSQPEMLVSRITHYEYEDVGIYIYRAEGSSVNDDLLYLLQYVEIVNG